MLESKVIVWIVANLTKVGGGERLLFEGAQYYRQLGYKVHIVTWAFDAKVLFNGRYSGEDIICLAEEYTDRSNILKRAFRRALSILELRRMLKKLKPSFVVCQSEYDSIVACLSTVFVGIPYVTLIFGQTYQFPFDLAKYSLIFRGVLKEIVASMPGYQQTIALKCPKTSLLNRFASEVICLGRYIAVRRSVARIVFSRQVQWEVEKLYGVASNIAKGAYSEDIFSYLPSSEVLRQALHLNQEAHIYLMLNRLVPKKRVDVCIRAFAEINDDRKLLLIGGQGSEELPLKQLVQDIGLSAKVRFLGYVADEEVWAYKRAADVFISIDIADFDISLYEALALGGKVVVTTEQELEKNIFDSGNVYIAEPSVESIATAMDRAIKKQSVEIREVMREYTWDSYFNTILHAVEVA